MSDGWGSGVTGWVGTGTAAVAPLVARAGTAVADAGRLLASAQDVEWVLDAASRYRDTLADAQQLVLRTQALVDVAHRATLALDRSCAHASTVARAGAASALLGAHR